MSASNGELVQRVREVVARVLAVDAGAVDPAKRIDQIAEIDSLSLAEIASGLDDAFGIRISTEALVEATTVGDLIAVVDGLVAEQKA